MSVIVDGISRVAKGLWALREDFRKAHKERHEAAANLFQIIGNCLAEVSASLKGNEIPHGKCAELGTYAKALPAAISGVVGKQKAEELAKELADAHEVERLLKDLYYSPNRTSDIAKLDEASGIFVAMANLTRWSQ